MKRELGYIEAFNAVLHEKVHGHGTIVLVAKLREHVKLTNLQQAAAVLFAKYPMLRATLCQNDGVLAFEFNAVFDDIPVYEVDAGDWQEVYKEELYRTFVSNKYLWRVSIMPTDDKSPHSYLFISCSHMIADGVSVSMLLNDVLMFIDKGEVADVFEGRELSVLPPIEQLLPVNKSAQDTIYKLGQVEKTKWPFSKTVPLLERRTDHLFLSFEEAFLANLHASCHQYEVSINSVLNAALLLAIQKQMPDGFCTSLCTPIDLRRFAKTALGCFGCNSGMVFTGHCLGAEQIEFWSLAKEYQTILAANIGDVLCLPKTFSDADIMPLVDMCLDPGRDSFFMDFGITNLGKIDVSVDQAEKIEFCYFSASRQAGDFVTLLCVLTIGNRLFIDFSYTEPLLSKQRMVNLANDFNAVLNDAVKYVSDNF